MGIYPCLFAEYVLLFAQSDIHIHLTFDKVRITDASLVIAGEQSAKTQSDLYTAAYTLQAAGLAPLLLASIGFIGLVYEFLLSLHGALSNCDSC
jgi:hypothetical protein